MNIKMQLKTVYGVDRYYPACRTADIFAGLVCKKTLDYWDLKQIEKLGYSVEWVTAKPDFKAMAY
jgi:hypothetical protein